MNHESVIVESFTQTVTSTLQKLKPNYSDIFSMKDDPKRKYTALYRYFRSLYGKIFHPYLIKQLLATNTGSFILGKYLTINYKGSKNAKLEKVLNVADYAELVKGELKFRKSDSRFVRDPDYKNLYPTVALYSVEVPVKGTSVYKKRTVAFVIDLVGKFEFVPHARVRGTYTDSRITDTNPDGLSKTKYTFEPYKEILPEYKTINDVFVLRADNVYTAFTIFNTMLDYEDTHEGVYDVITEKDMDIINQILTQTAVNGTKIYDFDDLSLISEPLSEMMYDKLLFIKSESNLNNHLDYINSLASKFGTKKNLEPSIQYLASQSAFSKHGFDYVEYDNSIDKDWVSGVNTQFNALTVSGVLPVPAEFQKPNNYNLSIRFRKMGRESLQGLYSFEYNMLVLDTDCDFLHQYGVFLDYNYRYYKPKDFTPYPVGDMSLSSTNEFKMIIDLYSRNLVSKYNELDLQDAAIQRELDRLIIPEEVFSTALEWYLSTFGINTFTSTEENSVNSVEKREKVIKELTFSVCESLKEDINKFFYKVLGDLDNPQKGIDKVSKYSELVTGESELSFSSTEDLSAVLSTTSLEYSEMTTHERHISVLAKKFMKKITLRSVESLIIQTDELYDKGIAFPNGFSIVFQFDAIKDRISDIKVITADEYQVLKEQGYRKVNTKAMLRIEQSFYELFYAQGVVQQVDLDTLKVNIRDMFHNA